MLADVASVDEPSGLSGLGTPGRLLMPIAGLTSVGFLLAMATATEPIERRLVRTIQTGLAQQVETTEILAHARSPETDFVGHVLARSALVALGQDQGFPEWPLPRLLDRVIDLLPGGPNATSPRPGFENGFGGDDLAFLVVYTLVMSGQTDAAIAVLEERLQEEGEFVRGVALQALRNIGSDKANRLIRKMGTLGRDGNLPENLIAAWPGGSRISRSPLRSALRRRPGSGWPKVGTR